MSQDGLSQNEIDALLNALSGADDPGGGGGSSSGGSLGSGGSSSNLFKPSSGSSDSSPRMTTGEDKKTGRVYRSYDFKRQTKFSREQLKTITMIMDGYARGVTTYLSTQLRAFAQAKIISNDQLTFEEFTRSISSPTFLCVFNMESLNGGSAILDLNLTIVFAIIDRLLGGGGHAVEEIRALSDIERGVMRRISFKLLDLLRDSWKEVKDIEPELEFIESNPQFAQIVPPTDMVLNVKFEVKIQEVSGYMSICFPHTTLEPISQNLNAARWFSAKRKEMRGKDDSRLKNKLQKVKLPVITQLGETHVTLEDILSLKVGDCIRMDSHISDDLLIRVQDKEKFKGKAGLLGNNLAVTVTEVIPIDPEAGEVSRP